MEVLSKPLDQHAIKIKSIQMDAALRDGESMGIVRLESGKSESEKSSSQGDACKDAAAVAQQAAKLVNETVLAADGQRLSASTQNPKYARVIL